jgi:hypothetical protein
MNNEMRTTGTDRKEGERKKNCQIERERKTKALL